MKRSAFIQKGLAAFLLVLFLVSSAPKSFFHDWVADHQDLPSCADLHTTTVLHKKSHDCDFDELVVTAPFVLPVQGMDALHAIHEVPISTNTSSLVLPAEPGLKESRGPPSLAAQYC